MPISPEELKELRESLKLTQLEAGKSVLVSRRTYQNWEISVGKENHRVIPEGLLELFCIKHNLDYHRIGDLIKVDVCTPYKDQEKPVTRFSISP